jgi:probable DNA repair protein
MGAGAGVKALLAMMDAGALVLTPDVRTGHALGAMHDAVQAGARRRAWAAPRILSLGAWIDQLWRRAARTRPQAPVLLGAHQLEALWESVLDADGQAGARWPLPAAAAARALEAVSLLDSWQVPAAAWRDGAPETTRALARWRDEVDARCRDAGWIDRDGALARLAEGSYGPPPAPPGLVVLVGFDPPTPAARALLDQVVRAGGRVIAWRRAPVDAGRARRLVCDSLDEEIERAGAWLRRRIDNGQSETATLAVPGLSLLAQRIDDRLQALPGSARHVVLSPRPLDAVPVAGDALAALVMAESRIGLEELGRYLLSPYFGDGPGGAWERARLDAWLRDRGERNLASGRLTGLAAARGLEHLEHRLHGARAALPRGPRRRLPGQWCEVFTRLLARLGWPGDRALDGAEQRAVDALRQSLSALATLGPVIGPVGVGEARMRLRRIAAGQSVAPAPEPARLLVTGVEEAAVLGSGAIWVQGLHDAAWPGPPRVNPFLPAGLQRRVGMPRCDWEAALGWADGVTAQLLSGAARVRVSHVRFEDDQPRRPSPLIAHLPLEPEPERAFAPASPVPLAAVRDDAGPALVSGSSVRGGARHFEDFAACPFRAFAVHRLGARGVRSADAPLDARVRGTLVHEALERLWSELQERAALAALAPVAREAAVDRAVEAALASQAARRPDTLRGRLRELERERLKVLLGAWIEVDLARPDFRVLSPEGGLEASVGGVRLDLRPDRVDRLADGRLLVLDYKTGQARPAQWLGERPEAAQIPAYVVLTERARPGADVAAAAYGLVRAGDTRLDGLGEDDSAGPGIRPASAAVQGALAQVGSWAALKADWVRVVESLARGIAAGDARVDPARPPATCRYCELGPVCRIEERGGAELAGELEHAP